MRAAVHFCACKLLKSDAVAVCLQGYYVNLLKTISLKLNEVTVQFFFQQLPGGGASFPLYTGTYASACALCRCP